MASTDAFSQACREAARSARRLPAELRRALSTRTRPEVTEPEGRRIAAAATGPHARILSAGVKPRTGASPQLVVGGASPRLSGGAGPRDVVYGDEFGPGKRKRTRQFKGRHPFIFPTIARDAEEILDGYARIVDDVLEEV
jgi:hypothetical protein